MDAIGRQFGYVFYYKSNIKNLASKVERLRESREDVDKNLGAESWNNKEISTSSAKWLIDVKEVTGAAKEVVEEAIGKYKVGCLNLKSRYVLSRKSTMLAMDIQKLQYQVPIQVAKNPALPPGMLAGSSSNCASENFKTRTEIVNKVMEALMDDTINIIGICGLGGIGKTTILHEVRERAITQQLFVKVLMITVSKDPNMFNIQSDLARMLGVSLPDMKDEGNNTARADGLHETLTKGNRILVILDDVWSAIELKEVRIPVGNYRANCKVILASRYKNVCTSMGTQETISVEKLSEKEAWHLFKKKAGYCVEKEKLEKIAKEVAGKCGGLPIALVTLASALSNKKREVWEDARRQLKQGCAKSIPGMTKNVYSSLRLSYDFLKRELPEAQPLLLICCQHPEDAAIKVDKLAGYCLALRLFKNVDKVVDARNRTYTVIDHLKSCFLLEEVNVDEEEKDSKYERVKMHVIVRDVCLSIVSEMKAERDKVYMHIMAPADTDGGYELDTGKVDYPKLMLFKAPLNGKLLDITFLEQMEGLRVFENVRGDEHHPPPALQVLKNLRMLSLERKILTEEIISTIGSLSSLEILSFWRSKILSFPRQIVQLRNLKLLDLRCEEGGGFIPSGMLSELKQLEVLCMGNFILSALRDKDIQNGENHGRITELDSLSNLTTLQINLVDPNDLLDLQRFRFENLESFYLGSYKFDYGDIGYKYRSRPEKTINLGKMVGMKWAFEAKIEGIVKSTMNLELEDIEDWTDPFLLEKFVSLSKLVLKNCKQLEYVIPGGSLEELQWLVLDGMPMMRHLWVGPFDPLCLGNLIEIHIDSCPTIECVFPYSAAKSLVQLQKLFIHDCLTLEGIVSQGELGITTTSRKPEIEEENPNDFILLFPKLRILEVRRLPKLGGFYNHKLDDGTTQQPFLNPLVMLPSLTRLRCGYMHQLKQIVGVGMRELSELVAFYWLQNLEGVHIFNCDSLETMFNFEGLHAMGEDAHVQILSKLKSLQLMLLPNLEHLCRHIPQGIQAFQNLQRLEVIDCDNLGYLISSTMTHMLVNLETLAVGNCKSMKKVVEMNENHYALFRSLRIVILRDCGELSSFCSSEQQSFEFPSLEEVCIQNCPKINTFCSGHVTAEKLHGVKPDFYDERLIWKGDLNETVRQLYARVDQMKMTDDFNETVRQLDARNMVDQMSGDFHETVRHLDARVDPMISDLKEDDVPEEGIANEYAECTNEDNTGTSSSIPLEFDQMTGDLKEDGEYVECTNEVSFNLALVSSDNLNMSSSSSLSSVVSRGFSLNEIKDATNNFHITNFLGKGGEGVVYLGHLATGQDKKFPVAVKQLKPDSIGFEAEIKIVSKIQHPNLVSLLGYCNEFDHKILVYEYMQRGSLSDFVNKKSNICLSWKQRLKICVGAARGLKYLHTATVESPKGIIHRDMKPANILLDNNWVAKVSDFGMFKLSHTGQTKSTMLTDHKGTFGYFAPEYSSYFQISRKIDVYAFGVVLFEVLCRKMPWDRGDESYYRKDDEDLGLWAHKNVDIEIIEEISCDSLKIFADIIGRSLRPVPDHRPTMDEVVRDLVKALRCQEFEDQE